MSPVLNLTDNEEMSFDAMPPGKYFVQVFTSEMRETSGDGKLPKGTEMLWVHFLIEGKVGEDDGASEESEYYNRRAFANLVIPPDDYDAKKARMMRGNMVSFLRSAGYTQEEITNGEFELDPGDLEERRLIVILNRKPNAYKGGELDNNVIGFKHVDEVAEEGAPAGGLL